MLTCFDVKPEVEIGSFRTSYLEFVEFMKSIDLVASTGPIGERQSDTIMDTDNERDHGYFVVMSFRDRVQVDRAVELLSSHEEPSESAHKKVYSKVENQIFICWQDMD